MRHPQSPSSAHAVQELSRRDWTDREFKQHMDDLAQVPRDLLTAIIVVLATMGLAHCLAEFLTFCEVGALC